MFCELCGAPNDVVSKAERRRRRRRESPRDAVRGQFVGGKDWSKECPLDRDRPRCRDRRFSKRPRSRRERASGRCVGRPFFPRSAKRRERGRLSKFGQTTLDGLAMAVEKLCDVANAAAPKFDRFGRGVKATLAFVEGSVGKSHRLLDRTGVVRQHDGIPPKGAEILFQDA